jgi:ubiquinone/menaquinone biosynthesis C-methylase UbiE
MLLEDRVDSFHYPAQRDWQTTKAAKRYRERRSPEFDRRFDREDEIIGRWLDELPPESIVLDVPCGAGRLIEPVTRRRLRYVGADISPAMLDEARSRAPSPMVHGFHLADAAALPFADDSVDCVIIWRLLHHVRNAEVRRAILCEAARVTRRSVLLSFHHPFSVAALRKKFYRRFLGKGNGVEFTAARLAREAKECGLLLSETQGYRKYVSINWFARLEKA